MTRQEYKDYQQSFKRGTDRLSFLSSGLCSSCSECQDAMSMSAEELAAAIESGTSDEGGISSQGCDICGDSHQQTLYAAHGRDADDASLVHLEICENCVYYMEYGRLDDQTMASVERDQS